MVSASGMRLLAAALFGSSVCHAAVEAFYCEGDVSLRARSDAADPITCIGPTNVDIPWKQIPSDTNCKTDFEFYAPDPQKPIIFRLKSSVHWSLKDNHIVSQLSMTKPACNIRPGISDGPGTLGVDLLNVFFQDYNNTIRAAQKPVVLVCDEKAMTYSTKGAGGVENPSFSYWDKVPRSKCSQLSSRVASQNATATEYALVYQCPEEAAIDPTVVTSSVMSIGGWSQLQELLIAHVTITCGQPRVWPHCREISWCGPPLGFPYSGVCATSAPGASTIFNRFCSEVDLLPCFVSVGACTPCGPLAGQMQNSIRVCGRSALAADATVDAVRGGRMPYVPAYADIRASSDSGKTWSALPSCDESFSQECERPQEPHTEDAAAIWQSVGMPPSALAFAQRQHANNPSFVSAGVRREVIFGGGHVDAENAGAFASADCTPMAGTSAPPEESRRQCCLDFDRYLVCTLHFMNASLCMCGGIRRTCNAPTSCEWSKGNLGDDTLAPPDSLLVADTPEMALLLANSWNLAVGVPPPGVCTVSCENSATSVVPWCVGRDLRNGQYMCSRCFPCQGLRQGDAEFLLESAAEGGKGNRSLTGMDAWVGAEGAPAGEGGALRQGLSASQVLVVCKSGDLRCMQEAVCKGLLPSGSMCRLSAGGLMTPCPNVTSCSSGSPKSLFGLLGLVLLIPYFVCCCIALWCWRSGRSWGRRKRSLRDLGVSYGDSFRSDTYTSSQYPRHASSIASQWAGSAPYPPAGFEPPAPPPVGAGSLGPLGGLSTVIQYDGDAATRVG